MTISRSVILAAAMGALLVAAAPADAKKKKGSAPPPPPAAATAQCGSAGTSGMGSGMARGMGPGESFLLGRFDDIDTDKNGQLSRAEVEAWAKQAQEQFRAQAEQRFAAADSNGDGRLSREEVRAGGPHLDEHFEFLDANGDGFLTLAELDLMRDPERLRQRILDRVQQADTDRNGKLDLSEVQAAFPGLAVRFAALDRDHDGYLTPDDFVRRGWF